MQGNAGRHFRTPPRLYRQMEAGVLEDPAGGGEVERRSRPADGIVCGTASGGLGHAGVAGLPREDQREGRKAPMPADRLAVGRLGHEDGLRTPVAGVEEVTDAVASAGLLVGVEEEGDVVVAFLGDGEHAGGGTLDVAGSQSVDPIENQAVSDSSRAGVKAPHEQPWFSSLGVSVPTLSLC